VVITGDTRPCAATVAAARGADLLVHDSTFGDAEADRALETLHSTARQAAQVAREAGVARLLLTHLSTRYDRDSGTLLTQARAEFDAVEVAHDGLVVELPLPEEAGAAGQAGAAG
jgi:ribonuclease Z